jgi:hypothetical protein
MSENEQSTGEKNNNRNIHFWDLDLDREISGFHGGEYEDGYHLGCWGG